MTDQRSAVRDQRCVSKNIGDKSMMKSIVIWLLATAILISAPHRPRAAAGKNLPHRFPGFKHCFW